MDHFIFPSLIFPKLCLYNTFKEIPGMATYFMDSFYDWGYKLKVKKTIAGAGKDRTIKYPRGFNLGGSG